MPWFSRRAHRTPMFFAISVSGILTSHALGETLRVPLDYATIQAAIDAAAWGDTIQVADGTYTGPGNKDITLRGKVITVRSENGPAHAVIDCEGSGRGFYITGGEPPTATIDGFTIMNAGGAGHGGAFRFYNSSATIRNCVIKDNWVVYSGAAIYSERSSPTVINSVFVANIASGNIGGGLYAYSDSTVTLRNCTIVGNHAKNLAGGISSHTDSQVIMTNCIVWGNSSDSSPSAEIFGSTVEARFCDVKGGWTGEGNIDADPLFADAALHLPVDSPCVNTGDPGTNPPADETDIDGEGRLFDGAVDIGADEYHDCNGNGIVDYLDAGSASPDCDGDHIPDECQNTSADCNTNGTWDLCDIDSGASMDCAGDEIPDECEPDCNGNGQADSCDIFGGTASDCNRNDVPDECDINGGASADCTGNGVPDECEPDCNHNATPDSCDIASGFSEDCNNNGVPDECDIVWREQANLTASDGEIEEYFGESVAMDGDVVVVGAYYDDDPADGAGSVYVYRRHGLAWIEEAKLTAPDPDLWAAFGSSVAIEGDTIVVGADGRQPSGAVYVYRHDGTSWTPIIKLIPFDEKWGEYIRFGDQVAISGNRIVVGCDYARTVYVFALVGNDWTPQQALTPTDPQENEGWESVAISSKTIVVGAPQGNFGSLTTYGPGSAYVFAWNGTTWLEEGRLYASDSADDDFFGGAVAVNAGRIIVGAPGSTHAGLYSGTAYVFEQPGGAWTEVARLQASDAFAHSYFGRSIALMDDIIAIGAPRTAALGASYLLRHDGSQWYEESKVTGSTAIEGDRFGSAIAMSDGRVVVGAPGSTSYPYLFSEGSVFILDGFTNDCDRGGVPDECQLHEDCNGNALQDLCDIAHGVSGDCNGNDVPDECDIAGGTSTDCDANAIPDECEAWADCNATEVFDPCDIADGMSEDCNGNVIPDECDLFGGFSTDCNGNTVPDECDIASAASQDCNGNALPDECDGWLDCNANGIFDACDIVDATSRDCNDNSVPDECDAWTDCNVNATFDACDIADGASSDCNSNGLPDECDINGGASIDCNVNGVPDACDLIDGSSRDCDENGVPDECDAWNDCDGSGVLDACEIAFGAHWIEDATLSASDPASRDRFGFGVDIDGNTVVVGAAYNDDACPSDPDCDSGAAYIYRYDGTAWIEETKLTASDGAYRGYFGISTAISGNTIVIGASGAQLGGVAYVFRRYGSEWVQEATLTASDAAEGDQFGSDVAIDGNVLVVGAYVDDIDGAFGPYPNGGSAYVFRYDGATWIEEAHLVASDADGGDRFGTSIDIDGDIIAIGAVYEGNSGPIGSWYDGPGAAYVFAWDGATWIEQSTLTASNPETDSYGGRIAVGRNLVVVGAATEEHSGLQVAGAIYVYRSEGSNWVEQAWLTASDAESGDQLGSEIAFDGGDTIIAAASKGVPGGRTTILYVFKWDGYDWVEDETRLIPADGEYLSFTSLAMSGDGVVMGTGGVDDFGVDSGAAYLFYDYGSDCNGNYAVDACDIAAEISDDINTDGVPDECQWGYADCNGNRIPDEQDVADGTSPDCNGNQIPDECEPDCQPNGVADECDISSGFSSDDNVNGIPDECDPKSPIVAGYPSNRRKNRYISFDPNKAGNDGLNVAFTVEIKEITLGSCDGPTGNPPEVDFCREDRGSDDCRACSSVGNACINLPIDCAPMPPQTCDPTGETCVNDAPNVGGTSAGRVWWVGPESPLGNGVHLMVSEPFRKVSTDWPNPTHAGDCEIVPEARYGVRAVAATADPLDVEPASDELVVETTLFATLSVSWWADCVGPLKKFCGGDIRGKCDGTGALCVRDGECPVGQQCIPGRCNGTGSVCLSNSECIAPDLCVLSNGCSSDADCTAPATCNRAWTLPDGSVNFDDVAAALALVAPGPTSVAPESTWVDLHGNATGTLGSQNFDPPNFVLNFSDIGQIISGFGGFPYKGYDPADCPDERDWP